MDEFRIEAEDALEIAGAVIMTLIIGKALRKAFRRRTNKTKTTK
jgi:hypothetical protein